MTGAPRFPYLFSQARDSSNIHPIDFQASEVPILSRSRDNIYTVTMLVQETTVDVPTTADGQGSMRMYIPPLISELA